MFQLVPNYTRKSKQIYPKNKETNKKDSRGLYGYKRTRRRKAHVKADTERKSSLNKESLMKN